MSRIVTVECAQKCVYMYKRIHTYTHSLCIIYSYIYTRGSSTYNTRCPYRILAFTNDLVATKIGVALFYRNVRTCTNAFVHMYILQGYLFRPLPRRRYPSLNRPLKILFLEDRRGISISSVGISSAEDASFAVESVCGDCDGTFPLKLDPIDGLSVSGRERGGGGGVELHSGLSSSFTLSGDKGGVTSPPSFASPWYELYTFHGRYLKGGVSSFSSKTKLSSSIS